MSGLEDSFRRVVREVVLEELHALDESGELRPVREMYSIRAAAERLNTSEAALRKRIERGQVKAEKVGGRVLVPRVELDRLLREGLVEEGPT